MNNNDLLSMAFRNLKRRKVRSLLSIVGVVIGTTSIVVMLSLGIGLNEGNKKQVEKYENLHIIQVMNPGGVNRQTGEKIVLDDAALRNILAIPGATAATPVLEQSLRIVSGKYVADATVIGIRSSTMEAFNYKVKEGGRTLRAGDKNAMVFGQDVLYEFYNPKKSDYPAYVEPDENGNRPKPTVDIFSGKLFLTGDTEYGNRKRRGSDSNPSTDADKKKFKQHPVKAVGVLETSSGSMGYQVMMDYDYLSKILEEVQSARGDRPQTSKKKSYDEVAVYVKDVKDVKSVLESIREMGFETYSPQDWLNQVEEQGKLIQGILGGIGAISLLVAAIGITNTMIMSIYERTREIGVMKVIGANLKDIRNLFLLEAALIGVSGGVIGVMFSYLISFAINKLLTSFFVENMMGTEGSDLSIIPFSIVILAIVFSTAIGVLSGYYPANRAMKISALESLKNE
ncbi:ABC transporter permease [Filifactor alocis]